MGLRAGGRALGRRCLPSLGRDDGESRRQRGNVPQHEGVLGCRLYSSPTGFPKEPTPRQQQKAITGTTVRYTFEGVPTGTYAVSVMHDENANGKLDANFLGIPTEGYGVSNNHTHAMSAPTWDESKFDVKDGQDVRLGIALRY
jgi:uncharacterized protein (DUF2141 family)